MEQIADLLTKEFGLKKSNTLHTMELIADGNTIPFIARYRKELTGNMSDEVLRNFDERLRYLQNLETRKEEVIRLIDKQGKLTPQLEQQIDVCMQLKEVEDLYLPFRPKKRTRATIAKERGLEPLAEYILHSLNDADIVRQAEQFIDEGKGVATAEDAVHGACDILAERFAETAEYRKNVRALTNRYGFFLSSAAGKDEETERTFAMYADYRESIPSIADHRILALNRGEKKKALKLSFDSPSDEITTYLNYCVKGKAESQILSDTVDDSYKRLLAPAIERDIRASLTERAEKSAIEVFAKNLKSLLLASPVKGKVIMGFDPAFRTGCKLAVINPVGKLLTYATIYPTAPQNRVEESKETMKRLIDEYQVDIISIGNGTASRESEQFVADVLREVDRKVEYVIVNEAGASVYSASELGTKEYPDLNVSIRGAVSIAQRLKDPLAELVKIDPKHIGVGQYQHDVDQKQLAEALKNIVEDAVNSVGVDVNTASPALLSYVSGLNAKTATAIHDYVKEHNGIKNRTEFKKIDGIGPKAFEQSAGFLRVADSTNVLDRTAVHPESYKTAKELLQSLSIQPEDLLNEKAPSSIKKLDTVNTKQLAETLQVGVPTLKDILDELKKPGRDPRDELNNIVFKSEVMTLEDLTPGMKLTGTVRNVTHFGAFVDIGVHEDGLVHISQLSDRFVKDPFSVVSVGDIVEVKVLDVDVDRKRISLTMKKE